MMDLLLVIQRHLAVLRAHSGLAPKAIKQTLKTFRRHVCKVFDCLLFLPDDIFDGMKRLAGFRVYE